MLQPAHLEPDAARRGLRRRHPLVAFCAVALLSNLAGSAFSILYNYWLIIRPLGEAYHAAFWLTVALYNLTAYAVCLALVVYLLRPLARYRRLLRAGEPEPPGLLLRCQRRLINLPALQMAINFLGWIPGAFVFPLSVRLLGGWDGIGRAAWAALRWEFGVSFLMSALLTTVQTYFLLEAFLFKYLYPEFFRHDRPAAVAGVFRITFRQRMILYWVAVALLPLGALLVIELCGPEGNRDLRWVALGVAGVGVVSSAVIGAVTGRTLLSWLKDHVAATEQVAAGNFDYRIAEKRPGEFGRLTDRFNDMAADLSRARLVRETFGQFVRPDVAEEILAHFPGLGGEVEEVTVVFIDIRGFTRRSAGEPPQRVVEMLNRFLTLAVAAVEGHDGWVNKFLGDGLMALFGAPRPCAAHADRALAAALDLLGRLARLNDELKAEGQAPLGIGVGMHTGPALVGCVGATLRDGGAERMRKEFTAIGETVNLASRIEQKTKTCGGPVLLSDATRQRLRDPVALTCLGPQELHGCPEPLTLHRLSV
jgi:adenylate cyclase